MAQTHARPDFKPYVADEARLPELSLRALVVGAALGVIFGASSVYLALKAGVTVSASVPIAVISITLFRSFSRILGGPASILENTVVQTTGSAGESIAAGVAFTLPALVLLGFEMDWTRVLLLSLSGGILGVLMMIPLRRQLIVKEHGVLTYPEGTASAEVLIAGEGKGIHAGHVFKGLFVGLAFKLATVVAKLWPSVPAIGVPGLKASKLACDLAPEYLGVGYIIGYRSAAIMVGGGLLSWLVLIPAISLFGHEAATPLYPSEDPIAKMKPDDIWESYIRYIGAGAVAAGGIINLIKALPTIIDSFRASFRDLQLSREGTAQARPRTERDLPFSLVVGGSLLLVLFMTFLPQLKAVPGLGISLVSAVVIVLFGFFFSVVSSRITGELGSSSNPVSGMAIATLMGTCLVFVALRWTGHAYTAAALSIGAVVCIAASNAGTTSQDLKTSFLVGGTPWRQQVAIIVGVVTSVVAIGWTLQLLNRSNATVEAAHYEVVLTPGPETRPGPDQQPYAVARAGGIEGVPDGTYLVGPGGEIRYQVREGIGSKAMPAPQANLMRLVTQGILTHKLPWGFILLGVFISVLLEVIGVPALAFAVGVYLPIDTTAPIFVGGLARRLVDWKRGASAESDAGPGVLYSSGLVAGGSIIGLAASLFGLHPWLKTLGETLSIGHQETPDGLQPYAIPAGVGFLLFLGVAALVYRTAVKAKAD